MPDLSFRFHEWCPRRAIIWPRQRRLRVGGKLMSQLMLQRTGQSERARLRNTVRQLLRDLVAINARRSRLICVPGLEYRLLRIFKNLPQQDRFELARDFADLLFFG